MKKLGKVLTKIMAGVGLGGITLCGVWFYLENQIEKELVHFQEQSVQKRQVFTYDRYKITGFPLRLKLEFENLRFQGPVHDFGATAGGDLLVDLSVPLLKVRVPLWNYRMLRLKAKGPTIFTWQLGASQQGLVLEKAKAKVWLNSHLHISEYEMEVHQLIDAHNTLSLEKLALDFQRLTQVGNDGQHHHQWAVQLYTHGWRFHQPKYLIGTEPIHRLNLSMVVTDPVYKGPFWRAVKNWRDSGGVIDIKALDLSLGELEASFQGTCALDQELRPLCSFQTKIFGYSWLLKQLVKEKLIHRNEAIAAQLALTMLAQTEGDQRGALNIPITAQDGKVSIGPLMLAPLPAVSTFWPKV